MTMEQRLRTNQRGGMWYPEVVNSPKASLELHKMMLDDGMYGWFNMIWNYKLYVCMCVHPTFCNCLTDG